MNWMVIIIVSVVLTALLVFLIRRNMKDEKKFEQELNKDYPHATDNPTDIDLES